MSLDAARLEEDRLARERALNLASFIVEAPAGAGKTELLAQRTLRLLAVVRHPEEVLALTFTNKAATEMRDRILGSLERAARGEVPTQPHKRLTCDLALAVLAHDAAQGWSLLQHPGRLRITTLDALCASLARQMPYLSRFGNQPGVTGDAEAHYATAARRTLEMVEQSDADGEVVAAALAFMANDSGRLERLLVSMLGKRDQWLPHAMRLGGADLRDEVEAGFALLLGRDLAAVAALLDADRQRALLPLARFAAANASGVLDPLCDRMMPLTADHGDLPAWRALAKLLLTDTGTLRKSVDKRIGFPADTAFGEQKAAMKALLDDLAGVTGLAEALQAVREAPLPEFGEDSWFTVSVFTRLLRLAAGQLWLAFQEAGEVDFIEIASRASLALGDDENPTDLAQALDYRIQHLLVDEFQDTSPGQVELLARLTRGWQADDGRTLFVVGDPMQSIYRFRKADVGLFLDVRERGIGDIRLEHLRLFRNNRSHPAVVDWVNQAFPSIFPAADDTALGAVRYAPSAATREVVVDSGVLIHPVLADGSNGAEADEAVLVRQLIETARAIDPQGRVAVLVRARKHLDALVAEIRRAAPALRFQAVEIEALADRQHIQDLLSLFHALQHRADRVHWLAMLRAPWCGLTLADLHALVAGNKTATVWELIHEPDRLAALSVDGRQRLAHVAGVLALAFAERGRQSPRRWLEAVWLMLGGPQCLETPAGLADVQAFFVLLDELAASRRLDAETLATRVAELFAPPDPLAGEAVQMMTVHKAKGLEFETVIVPGLHRETGGNESPMLLWDEVTDDDGRDYLLVAPMPAKGGDDSGSEEPSLYDALRRLEAARSAHEDERLLYVAATRAIRRLHLVGVARLDADKDGGVKPPAAGTLLRRLWPGLADTVFAEAAARVGAAGGEVSTTDSGIDPASFAPPLLRLRAAQVPAALQVLPDLPRPAENPPAAEALPETLTLEASVGTLLHRCLELLAARDLSTWDTDRITAQLPAYTRWLRQHGHGEAAAAQGATVVVAALQTTLASPAGRWLLAAHDDDGAEQAWSSRDGASAVNHVIDRIFVADGERWIIDYKTVREPPAQLPARAEAFRPQLERYAALFADDPTPLRLAIFFPVQGVLVELPRRVG